MDFNRRAELMLESAVLTQILGNMPNTAPSALRELRIQNEKLLRMLLEPQQPGGFRNVLRLLGGPSNSLKTSVRKARKEQGKRAQKMGHQVRKVHVLRDKFFKEWLRRNNPALTNQEFRAWNEKLHAAIAQSVQKRLKEIEQSVAEQLK